MPEPDAESFGPVARKLGEDIARALCREFGGMRATFPQRLVATRECILKLRQDAITLAEIARRLGCTERHVHYVLARERV
ncbi:MAG: helix-turn-helix domain-containing protein [Candidatus Binataceae bacterium]